MNALLHPCLLGEMQGVEVLIPIVAIGGGIAVWLVSIVTTAVRRTAETRQREESRREIAAYVAEGSISADDAAKLLNSGKRPPSKDCA